MHLATNDVDVREGFFSGSDGGCLKVKMNLLRVAFLPQERLQVVEHGLVGHQLLGGEQVEGNWKRDGVNLADNHPTLSKVCGGSYLKSTISKEVGSSFHCLNATLRGESKNLLLLAWQTLFQHQELLTIKSNLEVVWHIHVVPVLGQGHLVHVHPLLAVEGSRDGLVLGHVHQTRGCISVRENCGGDVLERK